MKLVKRFCRALGAGVSIVLGLWLLATASAGVPEFNEAMRRGDIKAASAEAVEIWKTWDTSDPDTALMAREFGFVSMMAGNYEAARDFGRFLSEQGATLPTPDAGPVTSEVLYRASAHKLEGNAASRAALVSALEARRAEAGIDLITVNAAEILYAGDWSKGEWEALDESGPIAVDLLTRGGQQLLTRLRRAEITAAAANFLNQRRNINNARNDTYEVMASAHDRIVADLNADGNAALRDELWPLKWEAEAWSRAMASFLTSDYSGIDTLIQRKLEPRALEQPSIGFIREDPELAPFPLCEGKWEGRRIRYPQNNAFTGTVGAVIVRIATDGEGKVTDTEVLASIPLNSFSDAVTTAVRDWRFEPERGADLRNCRLEAVGRVLRVTFFIG